jgi:hypothetical protein
MSDPLGKITEGKDFLGKLRNSVAGFLGYVDRENRREADKILRQQVADRYEEQWSRVSAVQRQLVSEGELELMDDLEAAAIKIRTFVDRIRRASYGYAGFFDAVRINADELDRIYEHDLGLLEGAEDLAEAVDNLEASVGTEDLEGAIRKLTEVSEEANRAYERRKGAILASESPD